MKTVKENSREARLADFRLYIGREESWCPPSDNMDLVFTMADELDNPIHKFNVTAQIYKGDTITLGTTQEKLDKEFKGLEVDKAEWLAKIKAAEKKLWQDAVNGDVFWMAVQKWNADERKFECVDSLCMLYGIDDVKANVAEMQHINLVTAIVDTTCCFDELDLTEKGD